MGDTPGGRTGRGGAEELILRTIATHADSLLRTARRHSLCVDDAQDAYQRGLEIFMKHADRLDPGRAGAWLHTVVKREAKSIRRSRQKLVGSSEVDLDAHEARQLPTPEEQLLSFDMVNRSAEALQRLKPHELRALWLKAQGHSYSDIAAITGWSYTKVNRCLTEGRRSFLTRYAGIESGEECARWMPVLSAMVDGEATPAQVIELRPHLRNCPGCRSRLKALQDTTEPLAALFPVPLAVAAAAPSDPAQHMMLRAYEAMAGGLHERAVNGVTKAQAILEASSAGKVAAVAASAAAVAGGGYVSVDTARPGSKAAAEVPSHVTESHQPAKSLVAPAPAPRSPTRDKSPTPVTAPQVTEFGSRSKRTRTNPSPEFSGPERTPSATGPAHSGVARSEVSTPAPEFATRSSTEFGP